MDKFIITLIGIGFDPNKAVNELSVNLPEGSKILSVTPNADKPCLCIDYMYPKNFLEGDWCEFKFVCVLCSHTEIEVANITYISTIEFNSNKYAVFYKKVE